MGGPFIQRLEQAGPLSEAERDALQALTSSYRAVRVHEDIVTDQDPERISLVLSGIAGRYKILQNGGRRIVSFALPGDLCRVYAAVESSLGLRVNALTPCTVADISRQELRKLMKAHSGIHQGMWSITLTELSRAREWLVNDSRPADKRLAHHFCELLVCLQAVGLARENSFDFHVSQPDLADTLSVSVIHTNRTLQALRSARLIITRGNRVTIPDVPRLKAFAEFDPGYLCLNGIEI
ncbi:Crp/Fnr family transcriptional regulator [Methylobacterium planeticum]|uniref:Crp/Fnr family transcriptional regulator n=1 Tax=Methylobacterium planeticum TaxID=2615211 RepID=A0A6N6MQU1_9HYPH|nr:Crp/Fnr family transcriptional regulator [Methylobacterium planeticum]KAB1071651.1 Crp/Fnr family transcriptional regulator [Methylobacterium planeticum]